MTLCCPISIPSVSVTSYFFLEDTEKRVRQRRKSLGSVLRRACPAPPAQTQTDDWEAIENLLDQVPDSVFDSVYPPLEEDQTEEEKLLSGGTATTGNDIIDRLEREWEKLSAP